MENDVQRIREELYKRVLLKYDPSYDLESAEDHNTNWLALSREEFDRIKRTAIEHRAKLAESDDVQRNAATPRA